MHLPWMDGLRFGILGNFKQMRDLEIRFCRSRRPHKEGLVHLRCMLCELIGLRVHSHCPDPKSVDRASYTASNLASIRYKDFVKHLVGFRNVVLRTFLKSISL